MGKLCGVKGSLGNPMFLNASYLEQRLAYLLDVTAIKKRGFSCEGRGIHELDSQQQQLHKHTSTNQPFGFSPTLLFWFKPNLYQDDMNSAEHTWARCYPLCLFIPPGWIRPWSPGSYVLPWTLQLPPSSWNSNTALSPPVFLSVLLSLAKVHMFYGNVWKYV